MKRIASIFTVILVLVFLLTGCSAVKIPADTLPSEAFLREIIPEEAETNLTSHQEIFQTPPVLEELLGDIPLYFSLDESLWQKDPDYPNGYYYIPKSNSGLSDNSVITLGEDYAFVDTEDHSLYYTSDFSDELALSSVDYLDSGACLYLYEDSWSYHLPEGSFEITYY